MGYMHIDNLYKNQTILMFRRCFALEKVHGTSAHIHFQIEEGKPHLRFFSGGESHDRFCALFDRGDLEARFGTLGHAQVTIFGEAYGGRCQGMRATYGDELRFIAFDVQVAERWLSVPDAAQVVAGLGLEMVPFEQISTDLADLDRVRDQPSLVAQRRGCGDDKHREGVVLRPLVEVTLNNGDRVIAKHKGAAFAERASPPPIADPDKLAVLSAADAIAQEWVTPMRLTHVLDKIGADLDMRAVPQVIAAMIEDVLREATGEIVDSREARVAIGRRTSQLFRDRIGVRT